MASILRRAGSALAKIIQSAADPAAIADGVQIYAKIVGPTIQLFARASDGTIYQLTPGVGGVSLAGAGAATGRDGDLHYDGVSNVLGVAPVGGVYTSDRNIFPNDVVIDGGVTVNPGANGIFARGVISGAGSIKRNGNPGVTTVGGAALAAALLPGSTAGGTGGASGGVGGASANGGFGFATGLVNGGAANVAGDPGGLAQGGGGGGGTTGAGGASGTTTLTGFSNDMYHPDCIFTGRATNGTIFTGATGGGGGGAAGGFSGGGGGSGGGWIVIVARAITLAGTIEVKGGDGADSPGANGGGGGGGGGGVAIICVMEGALPVPIITGGQGGAPNGGKVGGAGGNGIATVWSMTF